MFSSSIMRKLDISRTTINRDMMYQNSLVLGLFLIYATLATIFFVVNGLIDHANYAIYKLPYYFIFGIILLVKLVAHMLSNKMVHGQYMSPNGAYKELRTHWLNLNVVLAVFVPLVMISLLMSIFGSVKTLFPLVNPFFLDFDLMELDRTLHFGFHPWEITHALFGSVFMTSVLDFLYQLWFILLMAFTVWMVTNYKLGAVRTKFLVSYVLTWSLLGTLLAAILSAAGPCFYGDFVQGENVYGPLMERLNEISNILKADGGDVGLYAMLNQGLLWSFYTDDYIGLGSGITAMPSMHVSFAMLLFLSVRELNRKAGYVALLYLVLIQIGSVHLGWHYALDGYVSIILTWVIWRFSGWLTARVTKASHS